MTELVYRPWGTVSADFWETAGPRTGRAPASDRPVTPAHPPQPAHNPAGSAGPGKDSEAELPPPTPGTQYVPRNGSAATAAPPRAPEATPSPTAAVALPAAGTAAPAGESPAVAAWRHMAVAMASHFLNQANDHRAASQAAHWNRVRRELASAPEPWSAATELWLATAAQLIKAQAPTEETAHVLRDAYNYWAALTDHRQAAAHARWLLHLLRQVAALPDLADAAERWITTHMNGRR